MSKEMDDFLETTHYQDEEGGEVPFDPNDGEDSDPEDDPEED